VWRRAASLITTPLEPEDFLAIVNPLSSTRQLRGVVTAVLPETAGSATIRFRPGRGWAAHRAGQYARVGVEIEGVRHWRSYSLTTAAGEDPAITVTATGGKVSEALVRHAKPGDVLFLAPPQGDFVLPEHPRPLLMLTAGSGLTPVMSMVRTLTGRRVDADVVLVHSARTRETSLFHHELADLSDRHPGLRVVHWLTGERGRRLDLSSAHDLDEVCPDWRDRKAYVCGPAAMLDAATEFWQRSGIADGLAVERFAPALLPGSGGSGGLVSFERSDKELEVDGDTSLLEAGEEAGVVMPSGCRMGICMSCVTPLIAGRVRDLRTGEVHGDEGELIQTCISAAAGPVHLDI
jgi:ferredoxin-NADP reductase